MIAWKRVWHKVSYCAVCHDVRTFSFVPLELYMCIYIAYLLSWSLWLTTHSQKQILYSWFVPVGIADREKVLPFFPHMVTEWARPVSGEVQEWSGWRRCSALWYPAL